MDSHQRYRSVGTLVAVVSLLIAACTGTTPSISGTPVSPSGTSTPPATATAAASAIPQGGTLSIAWNGDIHYLDPALGYDTVSWPAERLLFETLVTYDRGTNLVPLLADGMPTVSNGGKTYTFKLHRGVKFVKPDGTVLRELTADDVVASINRLLDKNFKPNPSGGAGFFGEIAGAADVLDGKVTAASGIKAVDPTTVEFDLTRADATFLNVMGMPFASIVPGDTPHDASAVAANPIGTGPYLLKSYVKGQQATFVANHAYWQVGQPYLDELDFKVGADVNGELQQVQAGTLDLMGDPIPGGSFTQVTTDPIYADQVVHHTQVQTDYLFFDTQQEHDGPLSRAAVRQALEYAIDKDNIIKIVHGAGVKADCIFPPDMPGSDPTCRPYSYDPAKARQLLADAGYPNGFSSTLYTDTGDPDPAIAQAIQQDLAQVGVKIDVRTEALDTFLSRISTPHQAPMGWVGWLMDYPDPSDFIDPILSCATAVAGSSNYALYCDQQVDRLAADARGETDQAKRLAAYQQVQRLVMADAPWVPVRFPELYTLISKRVGGFEIHPVWQYDLRSLWVRPGS